MICANSFIWNSLNLMKLLDEMFKLQAIWENMVLVHTIDCDAIDSSKHIQTFESANFE